MNTKLLALFVSTAISISALPIYALAAAAPAQTALIVQTVNFRDQPSTNGKRIRYLQPGETLEIISQYNSSWLQAKDANGQTGYVSSSPTYIQLQQAPAAPPSNGNTNSNGSSSGKIISSVSFRTGPSTDASRIRYLSAGESVQILEKVNSYWYKVTDKNNVTGYISTSSQYIDTDFGQNDADNNDNGAGEEEAGEEASFPAPPNATAVSSVSFRTGPDTDASRIRYLKAGEKVLIISKTSDYWYKIQDQNGVVGYVSTSSSYISTTFTEPYKQLDPSIAAQRVIDAGMRYLGTPYEFGSSRSNTSTFDCSDFVKQAYQDGIGQQLPGDSRSQASYVAAVGKTSTDWHQLKRGDLMFFMSYKGSGAASYAGIDKSKETVTHVGIYLGNGQVLHTYSQASGGVRIDSFAGTAWEYRFIQGGSTY